MRFTCFSNAFATMSLLRKRRRRFRDFSERQWLPPCLERRTRPLPVTLNRFAAVFRVFILGMGAFGFSLEEALRQVRKEFL